MPLSGPRAVPQGLRQRASPRHDEGALAKGHHAVLDAVSRDICGVLARMLMHAALPSSVPLGALLAAALTVIWLNVLEQVK